MEALSLSKFEDSRLGNLHVVKGGDCKTLLNHSDGNQYHDYQNTDTGIVTAILGEFEFISWEGDADAC